ncbi:hypothetical protein K8I31_00760, partial [bacterium]|nr:hypothetical protein [bacterium]
MNWFCNAALCAACAAIVSPVYAAPSSGVAYLYQPLDLAGFSVVTSDEELPALLYLDEYYGIASVEEHEPLADGVLAELYYPNGNVVVISSGAASKGGVSPAQSETAPFVADTCKAEAFETGFPYLIAAGD